jgi:hypothetical protein
LADTSRIAEEYRFSVSTYELIIYTLSAGNTSPVTPLKIYGVLESLVFFIGDAVFL